MNYLCTGDSALKPSFSLCPGTRDRLQFYTSLFQIEPESCHLGGRDGLLQTLWLGVVVSVDFRVLTETVKLHCSCLVGWIQVPSVVNLEIIRTKSYF